MASTKKVVTVSEVLDEIKAQKVNSKGKTVLNRFNKKSFNKLMKAMMNDPEFKTTVASVKKSNLDSVDEISVTQNFREFIKKVLQKAGFDANDANIVMSPDFTFDDVEGLYEFFATAVYLYIEKGNRFDFIPKEDFKGSLFLADIDENVTTSDMTNPTTKEALGTFETTKKKHKKLGVKSSCPSYLTSRRKV